MIAVNYTPGTPRGAVTGGTRDIIYNRFAGPLFRPRFRRGVAQPGSAPALGAGGPRFKSGRPDQFLPGVVDRMLLGRCSGFRQVSASKIMHRLQRQHFLIGKSTWRDRDGAAVPYNASRSGWRPCADLRPAWACNQTGPDRLSREAEKRYRVCSEKHMRSRPRTNRNIASSIFL